MSILADHRIRQQHEEQIAQGQRGLIEPYIAQSVSRLENGTKITSVGESSFGYDISLFGAVRRMITREEAAELYGKHHGLVVDPCNFDSRLYKEVEFYDKGEKIVLQPGEFILAVTNEHFSLSKGTTAVAMEKSTLARSNITVTITPLEAGWSGFLTLEIRNNNSFPAHLTVGMGISQVLFFESDEPCEVSYADRSGKYQNQPQVPVIPRAYQEFERGEPISIEQAVNKMKNVVLPGLNSPPHADPELPYTGPVHTLDIPSTAVSWPFPSDIVTSDDRGNVLVGKVQLEQIPAAPVVNGIELVPIFETVHDLSATIARTFDRFVGWRLPDDLDLSPFMVSMSVQQLYDMLKHGDQKHRYWLQRALFAVATGTPIPDPY